MQIAFYMVLGLVAFVLIFIWWRWTSVERGARKRNERILKQLDSIGMKLSENKEISVEEVYNLAKKDELRGMLHDILQEYSRLDLFPKDFLDVESQARAELAYWLMHPNELQDPPEKIELVEKIQRTFNDREGEYFVLRYKMPEGHWAEKEGWLVGLSGPFFGDEKPYQGTAAAFSRFEDKYGDVKPAELVDWYVNLMQKKFG